MAEALDETRQQFAGENPPRRPERRLSSKPKRLGSESPKQSPIRTPINPFKSADSRITKSAQRKNSIGSGQSARASVKLSRSDIQKRTFTCAFSIWGCDSTFGSKNEWKRHVASQHLQLDFYRCDTGLCNPELNQSPGRPTTKAFNDFNRKDLFTQHHRRMHAPWTPAANPPSEAARSEFEASLEAVRKRCLQERRKPPQRSRCVFCRRVFEGSGSWEERMEHVGLHYEGKEATNPEATIEEDVDLRDWAVNEGIVKDFGDKGFWLVGSEPIAGGNAHRKRRAEDEMEVNMGLAVTTSVPAASKYKLTPPSPIKRAPKEYDTSPPTSTSGSSSSSSVSTGYDKALDNQPPTMRYEVRYINYKPTKILYASACNTWNAADWNIFYSPVRVRGRA